MNLQQISIDERSGAFTFLCENQRANQRDWMAQEKGFFS